MIVLTRAASNIENPVDITRARERGGGDGSGGGKMMGKKTRKKTIYYTRVYVIYATAVVSVRDGSVGRINKKVFYGCLNVMSDRRR